MRLVPPLKYFSNSCPLMRDTPHKCWEVRVRRLFLSERQLLLLSTAFWCKLKISWVLVKRQTIEKGVVLFPFVYFAYSFICIQFFLKLFCNGRAGKYIYVDQPISNIHQYLCSSSWFRQKTSQYSFDVVWSCL